MNETLSLTLALVAGVALGAIFFGGLWWTIRQGVSSQRPAQWFLLSLLLRMSLLLAAFYFIGGHDWRRLLACLAGFTAARVAVILLTRVPEPRHAP